jgi:hypothetical protein
MVDSFEHFEHTFSLGSLEMKPGRPTDSSSGFIPDVSLVGFDDLEDMAFDCFDQSINIY